MDYSAPVYNELAWHGATEKLMDIELTPRCKVLRTIAGELGRIQSHLLCVGSLRGWIWARSPRFFTDSMNAK